jgi:hypothetical protein
MGIVPLIVAIVAAILVIGGIGFWLKTRSSAAEPASEPAPAEPAPTGAKTNWLLGTKGEVAGRPYHIGKRTVTIGRDVGSFVQLQEAGASRRHLQLSPDPDGLLAVDMNSKNGTFVDEQPITTTVVKDGSLIRIGNAEFKYCFDADFDVEQDVGLGVKRTGAQAKMVTMTNEGSDPRQAARDAVAAANGDLAKAAKELGVDQKLLERFLRG